MTDGTPFFIVEKDITALGAFSHLSCNFNPAIGARGCFITDLMTALWAFDNSHNFYL